MTRLVEFEADGIPVLIQVRPSYEDVEAVGRLEDAIEKLGKSFRDSLGMVRQIAVDVAHTFKDSPVDSVDVELGLQLTGKGRLYVVEGQAQAALKVTIKIQTA